MKYKAKPVVIEAIQLNWRNWGDVCAFMGAVISDANPGNRSNICSDPCGEQGPPWIALRIPTLEGVMIANHGDWIIKGTRGEFYPVKPDIFAAKYEAVEEQSV